MYIINPKTNEVYSEDIELNEKIAQISEIGFSVYYKYNTNQEKWEMYDALANIIQDFPIEIDLSNTPKDEIVYDKYTYIQYVPYTQEEIEEQKKYKEEQDRVSAEYEKQQAIIDALPDRMNNVENTQDDIVLLLADIVGGVI